MCVCVCLYICVCVLHTFVCVYRREQKSCEFNLYEAYAIDLIVSTGEGRTKTHDTRTTVFRKTDEIYQLKMKASRGGLVIQNPLHSFLRKRTLHCTLHLNGTVYTATFCLINERTPLFANLSLFVTRSLSAPLYSPVLTRNLPSASICITNPCTCSFSLFSPFPLSCPSNSSPFSSLSASSPLCLFLFLFSPFPLPFPFTPYHYLPRPFYFSFTISPSTFPLPPPFLLRSLLPLSPFHLICSILQ